MSVYVIAEAGVNHNGSYELACKLADAAKTAGADCIKFQTFKADNLVSTKAPKANYQTSLTGDGSQYSMLKALELSYSEFTSLSEYCKSIDIRFLSTPFDLESINFLNSLAMPFWKIPSGEVTNLPYLIAIAKTGKPIVMSTGMCEMFEIEEAVKVLQQHGAGEIKLLQCNTEYPTPFEDVNLRAMKSMREFFGLDVGYSDHTRGIEVSIAAVALGATIIEKHFTLDRTMPGPDHKASIEPDELSLMILSIRNVERALGSSIKQASPSEMENKVVARKSIVAAKDISKGEVFTVENITVKRPGSGISPMHWFDVLGKVSPQNFYKDELIVL